MVSGMLLGALVIATCASLAMPARAGQVMHGLTPGDAKLPYSHRPMPKLPLNVNTASAESLDALGVLADGYAQRIVDWRPYHSRAELLPFVPQAIYDQIYDEITVMPKS